MNESIINQLYAFRDSLKSAEDVESSTLARQAYPFNIPTDLQSPIINEFMVLINEYVEEIDTLIGLATAEDIEFIEKNVSVKQHPFHLGGVCHVLSSEGFTISFIQNENEPPTMIHINSMSIWQIAISSFMKIIQVPNYEPGCTDIMFDTHSLSIVRQVYMDGPLTYVDYI